MFAEEIPIRVQNEHTGMDISVDDYKEVSGPLGGTTVEYRIRVATTRLEYKNSVQQSDVKGAVSFTAHKTFNEIEYFLKKLKAKYATDALPINLACDKSPLNEDREMRKKVANDVMSLIAKDKVLSSSTLLFSFLGYDPVKDSMSSQIKPSSNTTATNPTVKKPTKSSETIATKQGPTKDKIVDPYCSDDMFLEAKECEPTEEEDLFQEFKRQNVSVGGDRGSSSTLFADSPSKKLQSKTLNDDLFLFSRQNMGGALREDELDVNGLLVSSHETIRRPLKSQDDEASSKLKVEEIEELLTIDDSLSDIWKEMQPKKVVAATKPEVKTKPVVARKPTLPPKVTVASKAKSFDAAPGGALPVPAPRSKPVPTPRRSSTTSTSTSSSSSDTREVVVVEKEMGEMRAAATTDSTSGTKQPETAADLTALDILTYIEKQQQQQLAQNVDLFS